MGVTTLYLGGLNKRLKQLHQLDNPSIQLNATPLMLTWMKIIEQDNRTGVLNGTDKNGIAMKPVTYRPKTMPGLRVNKPPKTQSTKGLGGAFGNVYKAQITSQNKTVRQQRSILAEMRLNQRPTMKAGMFAGFGLWTSGLHNNLTSGQYRLLGGPPLAPRDQFSRVITNLMPTYGGPPFGARHWFAQGAWVDVVNAKGQPFLKYHFDGTAHLPKRDLRGVRPQGMQKATQAAGNWARLTIKELFS